MLGFGLGSTQKPLSPITDLFNGFDQRGTFLGGPTRVIDNLGVLTTSPANVLAVTVLWPGVEEPVLELEEEAGRFA